jgi:hypothetical protein
MGSARASGLASPLAQGRGSKHSCGDLFLHRVCRPSRRGVDRNITKPLHARIAIKSPLAQGRGSKQHHLPHWNDLHRVAPRAGAWIETRCNRWPSSTCAVAPRAGAWIETKRGRRGSCRLGSPLAQGRGSKRLCASSVPQYPSAESRLPESLHFAESDVIVGVVRVRSVHKVVYGHKGDWAAA